MTWEMHQLLAVTNMAFCMGIGWSCICRLNSQACKRLLLERARYALLLAGAVASGAQPVLWGSWPTIGSVIFALCVLLALLADVPNWTRYWPGRRKTDKQTGAQT